MKRLYAVAAIATTFFGLFVPEKHGHRQRRTAGALVCSSRRLQMGNDPRPGYFGRYAECYGQYAQYAVIRVYCSPILSDGNIVAMGVVTPSRPVFGTAVTIPAGIGNIYVQTTLPDGTVAVSMEPVAASVNVAGARMKAAAGTPLLRMAGMARAAADSSMPDYPRLRRRPRVISPRGPSSGVRLPARSTWVRAGPRLQLRSIISRQEPRLRAISA